MKQIHWTQRFDLDFQYLNTKNIDAVYSNLSDLKLSPSASLSPSIQLEPIKPFFSAHVSKKIYGLYKKFMESVDKETASANVSPLIDYLHKFKNTQHRLKSSPS